MAYKVAVKNLHSLAKLGQKHEFITLVKNTDILNNKSSFLAPNEVSILVYSFACLRLFDDYYWKNLESLLLDKKEKMNSQDFATCIWGFSKSHLPNLSHTWRYLEEGAVMNLRNFSARELATVSYAFAHVNSSSTDLWDGLKQATLKKLKQMNSTDLTLTSWAFSKAKITDEEFWKAIEKRMFLEIEYVKPGSLATIVYAFAKIQKGSPALWSLFENAIYKKVPNLDSRALANCIWSLSKMHRGDPKLWNQFVVQLKEGFFSFDIIDAVNSVWVLNKVQRIDKELRQKIVQYFDTDKTVNRMYHQDIMNLAWVLYNQHVYEQSLWDKLVRRLKFLSNNVDHFYFKSYKCFFNFNSTYWDSFGEKMGNKEIERFQELWKKNSSNLIKDFSNIVDMAYYCTHMKLGSRGFWENLSSCLKQTKELAKSLDLLTLAKFSFIASKKFPEDKSFWSWESHLWGNASMEGDLMQNTKATIIMLWSYLTIQKPESILNVLENNYKTMSFGEEEISNLAIAIKLMNNKSFSDDLPINTIIKEMVHKLDRNEKNQLIQGVFDDLFNNYLGRKYILEVFYTDFLKGLQEKIENYDGTVKNDHQHHNRKHMARNSEEEYFSDKEDDHETFFKNAHL